jgi:N-acetylmuramoyl-L-alanine amidase
MGTKQNFMPEISVFLAILSILYVQYTSLYLINRPPNVVYIEKTVYIKEKKNIIKTVSKSQLNCMAEAIYFESRGQPISGQKAVGHVIMNRVKHHKYPKTVCGVINQGCQFSYTCSGPKRITDHESFNLAKSAAKSVLNGEADITNGSLFFRTRSSANLRSINVLYSVGDHIFYRHS